MTKRPKDINVPNLRFPGFEGEWVEKKLGELCKMQAGKFVNASEISEEPKDKLFPCYGGNGLRGYTKSFTHNGKYSLIGRQGALCGNVTLAEGTFHATEHAVVVTPNKNIDTPWIFYLLVYLNLNQYATGMAQPGLSVKNLEQVEASTPNSTLEQQKIASFLSLLDKRIQTQSKIIEDLKTLIKATREKIFGQQGLSSSTSTISINWEKKKLGQVAIFFSGGTPLTTKREYFDGHIPFIRSGEINLDTTEQFISEFGLKNSSAKMVEVGDILFALYGATSGEVGICKIRGAINQAILCIRSEHNHYFIFSYLSYKKRQIVKTYLQGGQGNLSAEIIKQVEIPIPSNEEQVKIANLLSTINKKNELEMNILLKYQYQKMHLLNSLFI